MDKWDERYLRIAREVASWSKDSRTQVGAVLVKDRRIIATGYNGIPRGVNDNIPERNEPPEKYAWFEHAERNVLCNTDAMGATIYTTLFPCADCGRGIIQAGIHRVVTDPNAETRPHWEESFKRSRAMFIEAGIEVV